MSMTFGTGSEPDWDADTAEIQSARTLALAALGGAGRATGRAGGAVRGAIVHGAVSCRAPRSPGPAQQRLSRLFDIAVALALFVVALPALLLIAIALQIDSPGRLFFIQQRIGKGGVAFPCIKFRTMCENADAVLARHLALDPHARAEWDADCKLKDDPRVTRLGAIVRKFSIDEFPQLLNILLGHMAVVGPRPIVAAEIEKYSRSYVDYCAVRPGLTGLWQVSGRNDVDYRRRVALDRAYVRNKSLLLDARILAMTVPAVLGARGSY